MRDIELVLPSLGELSVDTLTESLEELEELFNSWEISEETYSVAKKAIEFVLSCNEREEYYKYDKT